MSLHRSSSPQRRPSGRISAIAALVLLPCLGLLSAPSWAQNAVAGRALFEDTLNTSGLSNLTGNCAGGGCHSSVQDRRIKIGGSAFAEISLTTALNHLGVAINSQPQMRQFQTLTETQVQDLAAYIADTPEVSTDQLNFSASAVNTLTGTQFVELGNSKAAPASETLKVVKVEITGAAATRFRRSADTCDQATLAVGSKCRVTIDFSAPDTAGSLAPLVFTLRQGNSATTFFRTVQLNGSVAVTAAPGGAASGSDSGGGALGWPWLLALGLATVSLALTRWQSQRRQARALTRARAGKDQYFTRAR
jgi:hypothetical protein